MSDQSYPAQWGGWFTMEDNRNITTAKKKLLWTAALHRIFLEAIIIIIGARKDVVAKQILEVMMTNVETSHILRAMNAQELTRTHVASHWQKLKKFLTTESRRKNKLGRWHKQSHYFRQQHMLIQRQLAGNTAAAAAASSTAPLRFHQLQDGQMFYTTSDNNINNNVVAAAGNLQAVLVAAVDEKNNVTAATNPIIICPSPYSPQEAILQDNDLINAQPETSENWFSEFGVGECDCLSGFLKDASITPQGIYGSFIGLSGDEEFTRGLEDIRGFQDLDLHQIV